MSHTDIFRTDSLNLMTDRFSDFERGFRKHSRDDPIADFFYQLVFDLIRRTAYTARKTTTHGREEFARAAEGFLPGKSTRLEVLTRDYSDRRQLDNVIDENYLFLERLRDIYRDVIRGMKPECWESLARTIATRKAQCEKYDICYPDRGSSDESLECEKFQLSWRTTSLVIEEEEKSHEAGTLRAKVYGTCPLLEFVTDPAKLENFLGREYCAEGENVPEHRSIRGLPVRLLTMFAGQCLDDLSDLLELPPEKRYALLP